MSYRPLKINGLLSAAQCVTLKSRPKAHLSMLLRRS